MRTSIVAMLLGAGALILGLAIGVIISATISGDIPALQHLANTARALVH